MSDRVPIYRDSCDFCLSRSEFCIGTCRDCRPREKLGPWSLKQSKIQWLLHGSLFHDIARRGFLSGLDVVSRAKLCCISFPVWSDCRSLPRSIHLHHRPKRERKRLRGSRAAQYGGEFVTRVKVMGCRLRLTALRWVKCWRLIGPLKIIMPPWLIEMLTP